MSINKSARLTPLGRAKAARCVLDEGQTAKVVATAFAVSERTVRNRVKRSQAEGPAGPLDRSSRPHRLHGPMPETVVQRIVGLRRERMPGKAITAQVGILPVTVSQVLKWLGLNKLSALPPAELVRRYEREHPGKLIHIDIKKLVKFNKSGHRATGNRRGQSNIRGIG